MPKRQKLPVDGQTQSHLPMVLKSFLVAAVDRIPLDLKWSAMIGETVMLAQRPTNGNAEYRPFWKKHVRNVFVYVRHMHPYINTASVNRVQFICKHLMLWKNNFFAQCSISKVHQQCYKHQW